MIMNTKTSLVSALALYAVSWIKITNKQKIRVLYIKWAPKSDFTAQKCLGRKFIHLKLQLQLVTVK